MTEPEPSVTPSRPSREDLEKAILGESPGLTAREVAHASDVPVDQARRLWRALGFPEHGGEPAFTAADVEALRQVTQLVGAGMLDFDTALNLTRAVGQTMARLADWEVGTLVDVIEHIESSDAARGSRMSTAMVLAEQVNPAFEQLLLYAWRRHLAASAARVEALGAHDEALSTALVTVGFADMVAFTALSNQLDEGRIGDLVEVFESRCADIVAAHGGRVIKSLGDSVLFVHESPAAALAMADGIVDKIGRDPRMPDVRLGLATGPVVLRMGDVFGRPVNLAARLTAVARRNRVIVDQATADGLPSEEYAVRHLPPRPIRGFGLIEPLAVRRHP
ncbi:MAG: adenylate/guanylate cyclase domain-containing protein [Nocardioidaceae bacterium]